MLLNFGGQKRSGAFDMVWPPATVNIQGFNTDHRLKFTHNTVEIFIVDMSVHEVAFPDMATHRYLEGPALTCRCRKSRLLLIRRKRQRQRQGPAGLCLCLCLFPFPFPSTFPFPLLFSLLLPDPVFLILIELTAPGGLPRRSPTPVLTGPYAA